MVIPSSHEAPGLSLEAPLQAEKPRGLVPRSALALILGVGFVGLCAYAFYDVNVNHKNKTKALAEAAAPSVGAAPPLKQLREIRAQQEGAPAAVVALQPVATEPALGAAPQPPVPATVMAAVGVPAPSPEVPRTRAVSAEDERRQAEARAKAEAAEAEHRARILMSPMVRLENKDDRGQADLVSAQLAQTRAASSESLTASDLQRMVEQERDQVMRALAQGQATPARQSNAQRDSQWIQQSGAAPVPAATTAVAPANQIMLVQNSLIPAVTLQAINSDLPGTITARVTEDVKDSLSQRHVLIPMGSRLVGRYSADISPGQERILLAFSRLILPDGRSVNLAGAQGVDGQGQSGMGGDVNNHWVKMFGHGLAIALIADRALPDKGVKQSSTLTSSTATRTVAGEVVTDVAKRVLDRNTQIPPTITAPMGQRIFIAITSDLVLQPWNGKENYVR